MTLACSCKLKERITFKLGCSPQVFCRQSRNSYRLCVDSADFQSIGLSEANLSIRNVLTIAAAFVLVNGCQSSDTLDDQAESPNGLVGAWLIVETTITTPSGTTMNENPQPGVYIFTERHFSNMLIPEERRSLFGEERTDEERLAAYDNFIADSGSYELTDSLLTTHNMIAKVPNAMDGGFPYRYILDGDSLVLTFDRGWAPPNGEITYRLVRLE